MTSLEESVRLVWNGDVDMGDGELQCLYEEYTSRLQAIPTVSMLSPVSINKLLSDIKKDLEDVFQPENI